MPQRPAPAGLEVGVPVDLAARARSGPSRAGRSGARGSHRPARVDRTSSPSASALERGHASASRASTGPRSAATGSASERGVAARPARARSGRARAAPRAERPGARGASRTAQRGRVPRGAEREPLADDRLSQPARHAARRPSSRARRSRCRCSRAGRPSRRGPRGAPPTARRSRRSRAARARRATTRGSRAGRARPSSPAEPLGHRRAEALLLAVDDLVAAERARDRLLQQVLADRRRGPSSRAGSASANSTSSWSRNGTRASTEVRHRHLVDAHEQQLGQALLELEVGHLLEQVGARAARARPRCQSRSTIVVASRAARGRCASTRSLSSPLVGDRAAPERQSRPRGGVRDRTARGASPRPSAARAR